MINGETRMRLTTVLNLDRHELLLIISGFLKQAITAFNTTEPTAREIQLPAGTTDSTPVISFGKLAESRNVSSRAVLRTGFLLPNTLQNQCGCFESSEHDQ